MAKRLYCPKCTIEYWGPNKGAKCSCGYTFTEADKDIARIQTSINDLNKAEEKADAEQNEIDKNIKLNRELYLQNQKANPDDTI
tara:strand:+ start:42 stop:293 length:252 start_codon:yes stop_codon:yes gene_type:complete